MLRKTATVQARKAGHVKTRAILDGQIAEKAARQAALDADKRREREQVTAAARQAAAADAAAAVAKLASIQALKAEREAQVLNPRPPCMHRWQIECAVYRLCTCRQGKRAPVLKDFIRRSDSYSF